VYLGVAVLGAGAAMFEYNTLTVKCALRSRVAVDSCV
jgi:hypothetical protein